MFNCPMKNDNYLGYCEQCVERTDCMIRDISKKIQELEETIKRLSAAQPVKS